jgi:hypothetical protein
MEWSSRLDQPVESFCERSKQVSVPSMVRTHTFTNDERRFKFGCSHQLTQTDYTMLENAIFLIATKYPK